MADDPKRPVQEECEKEWQRFEGAVKKLVNTPPKHKPAKKPESKEAEPKR